MDVHVPAPITRALRLRGVDVLTSQEDNTACWPDGELLDRATSLERVLFTRDQDFLSEVAHRQEQGRSFAGVIYAHQLLVTIGRCVADLELLATCSELSEFQNRIEFLPLR